MSRLFRNVPYICRVISRTAAFKAIKADLNVQDSSTEKARNVSKNVRTILNNLFELARAGGGSKAVHRHTVINKKLLVRERLKLLFDPDSPILEIGILGGMHMDYGNLPAAGSVAAIGKIQQQYCAVAANDGTVKGGTLFPITVAKQLRVQELSYLNHIPCIYLVDSGGAYLPLQADIFPDKNHGGRTFYNEAVLSSLGIPQIALVCGSCTAGGAYCPTMAEEAIIVNNLGSIFLAGPPLVKAATGEEVSEQDLGGADVHCRVSGCTDYFAETEEEAFELCKESVLALNLPPTPMAIMSYKEPCYNSEDLAVLAGKTFLSKEDMYILLSRILDESKFKEFKEKFGKNLILGFGFIYGQMVGIVANCNSLTPADADKGSHFIQLCQKRGIPLIFLQNSGSRATSDLPLEALRVRAKMTAAVSCAKVPKISINVGGCYLDDNYSMCSFDFKPNFFFSWPLAYVSHSRSFDKEERESDVRKISQAEVSSDYEFLFQDSWSPFYTASRMFSDGIIHPEETRQVEGCVSVGELEDFGCISIFCRFFLAFSTSFSTNRVGTDRLLSTPSLRKKPVLLSEQAL